MKHQNIDSLLLLLSKWISSLFFFRIEFIPPPTGGRRLWLKYLPLLKVKKVVTKIASSIGQTMLMNFQTYSKSA